MYSYKVMLKPNNKQMTRIRRTANMVIICQQLVFDYLNSFLERKEKIPSCKDTRKWFTQRKRQYDEGIIEKRKGMTKKEQRLNHLDTLFYDVSNDALKQGIKDVYNSFIRYFKKISKKPVRKDFKGKVKSFYVDSYKIRIEEDHVVLEKISTSLKANKKCLNRIRLVEKGRIPLGVKYKNVRVIIDDDRVYISLAVEDEPKVNKQEREKKTETIGIDVNIDSIDISKLISYKSPVKKKKYKRIEKSVKRLRRKISKQYELANKNNKKLFECKNRNKALKKLRNKKKRLRNIVMEYHNDVITNIISFNPSSINIEDLNIKGMLKNHKISRSIQISAWRKFFNKLTALAKRHGIEVNAIDRFFPSSKRCYNCGNIKDDLKLEDRIYICNKCGFTIRRDFNAALNIQNYYSIILK